MVRPKKDPSQPKKTRAPARTLESREKQLIALAVDLAERQLSEGTASSQVITHYLKLGSTTERQEREKLLAETQLLKAKVETLQSVKRTEELFEKAINAMRTYTGQSDESDAVDDQNSNLRRVERAEDI